MATRKPQDAIRVCIAIMLFFLVPPICIFAILNANIYPSIGLTLFLLIFFIVGLAGLPSFPNTMKMWILAMYGQTELLLTDREISLTSRLFQNYQLLVAPIQHISQIELVKDRFRDVCGQIGITTIPDRLNIWAGIKQFEIGDKLTKPELEWLAQVCSAWLDLPTVRDNTGIAARNLDRQN